MFFIIIIFVQLYAFFFSTGLALVFLSVVALGCCSTIPSRRQQEQLPAVVTVIDNPDASDHQTRRSLEPQHSEAELAGNGL